MRVARNSLATDKRVTLGFPIELDFRSVGFVGRRKPGNSERNPRSKDENEQQTQPTYDAGCWLSINKLVTDRKKVGDVFPGVVFSPAYMYSWVGPHRVRSRMDQ